MQKREKGIFGEDIKILEVEDMKKDCGAYSCTFEQTKLSWFNGIGWFYIFQKHHLLERIEKEV